MAGGFPYEVERPWEKGPVQYKLHIGRGERI